MATEPDEIEALARELYAASGGNGNTRWGELRIYERAPWLAVARRVLEREAAARVQLKCDVIAAIDRALGGKG